MATGRVEHRNEVWLNGHYFPIVDGVTRRPINEFAEKTVIGDYTEASDPFLSNVTWNDFRNGQGRYIIRPSELDEEHMHEFWEGRIRNDIPGHTVPPASDEFGTMFLRDSAGTSSALSVTHFAYGRDASSATSAVYVTATNDSAVHVLNRLNGFRQNLASKPVDFKIGLVNNVMTFAVAESTSFEWGHSSHNLTDSANWNTDSTQLMKSVAFWRDLLWGISDSGELFFTAETTSTSALGWTKVANANITSSQSIRQLITAPLNLPGTDDREHLILVRDDGFEIYDRITETFTPALKLPSSSVAGHGATEWNGSIFYPYGMSLYQWTPPGQVTPVGLDLKEGVADKYAGYIHSVAASPRQLFTTVKTGNDSTTVDAMYARTATTGWARVMDNDNTSSRKITARMFVGNPVQGSSEDYVAYPGWPQNAGVYNGYDISLGAENINNDSRANRLTANFPGTNQPSGKITSPWIVADPNQDWTAFKFSTELSYLRSSVIVSANISSFLLQYATDFNDSEWTTLIQLHSDSVNDNTQQGLFESPLPNAANPVGVPFTAIRWHAEIGSAFNNFYDIHRVSLTLQKQPKLRYAFSFDIDLRKPYKGHSAKELREFIDEFLMQKTLAPFNYHDDLPGGGQPYYVRAINPVSQEQTGQVERDFVRMSVMELV